MPLIAGSSCINFVYMLLLQKGICSPTVALLSHQMKILPRGLHHRDIYSVETQEKLGKTLLTIIHQLLSTTWQSWNQEILGGNCEKGQFHCFEKVSQLAWSPWCLFQSHKTSNHVSLINHEGENQCSSQEYWILPALVSPRKAIILQYANSIQKEV